MSRDHIYDVAAGKYRPVDGLTDEERAEIEQRNIRITGSLGGD